ncbi:malate dehydrogenase [Gammaproteobacteria bacterium]|jgi:malate dehydrogenase|nr:malate dehydrogenase [Gammaproteobacteria bacterium]MDA7709479.1 malate dehydrogenase [Gammaproteobacteria bacterium]MDA7734884.1 malate dehydrogenase [Gammaproteobacteria bacterium]MDA7857045.1 malate dehydrogenase [Gammaproteobacteria bacterium]MDA8674914.1 malate dehydrogenase [Gammaproteobacteria bacterium]|tara:strand:+ start:17715 stop:18713 length:999 start_codon:yes stop_codon:yes gene_type:complete
MSSRVKVVVTGAAGQIAYSLIPRLVDGKTFGDRIVDLCLVEIPQVVSKLEGLVMELEDSYFPHMGEVTYTDNFEDASHDADWFLLVGSIPRGIVYEGKKIEERSDLLKINGGIFVNQGKAIGSNAKDDAKILVVGNPANTNALIGKNASGKDSQLWMAMTMLDSSRAKSVLAKKTNVNVDQVSNMIIWGNHSPTMYPDIENAVVNGESISSVINDMGWVENEFLPTVQQRGKAVIDARGASSATSAAKAALDTVIACENPTDSNDSFSAAVESDGSYGVPEGLICGFPLSTDGNGVVTIKKGLDLSDFAKQKFQVSIDELISERQAVEHLMK